MVVVGFTDNIISFRCIQYISEIGRTIKFLNTMDGKFGKFVFFKA